MLLDAFLSRFKVSLPHTRQSQKARRVKTRVFAICRFLERSVLHRRQPTQLKHMFQQEIIEVTVRTTLW